MGSWGLCAFTEETLTRHRHTGRGDSQGPRSKMLSYALFLSCPFLFFFFLPSHACSRQKFLGQGWNLHQSSDNAGSLAGRPPGIPSLLPHLFFLSFLPSFLPCIFLSPFFKINGPYIHGHQKQRQQKQK